MTNGENKGFAGVFVSSLLGAAVAFGISLLLLLAATAVFLKGEHSDQMAVRTASCISVFAGGLVGGLISEKRVRMGAAFCGAVTAILLFAMLCLGGMGFYGGLDLANGGGLTAVCTAVGCISGALLGTVGKRRKKHR